MPPEGRDKFPALKTSTEEMPGDAISPKLNERPPPYWPGAVGIWRPFKVTKLNSGPNPRTAIVCPSTLLRSIAMPGTRAKDSAKLPSGNRPKSSAEIASITPVLLRLISIASSELFRMNETTISLITCSDSCAWRGIVGKKLGTSSTAIKFRGDGNALFEVRWLLTITLRLLSTHLEKCAFCCFANCSL